MLGLTKILWLGDFNFQPPQVGPPEDPKRGRRKEWPLIISEFGMEVLTPRRRWDGEGQEDDLVDRRDV